MLVDPEVHLTAQKRSLISVANNEAVSSSAANKSFCPWKLKSFASASTKTTTTWTTTTVGHLLSFNNVEFVISDGKASPSNHPVSNDHLSAKQEELEDQNHSRSDCRFGRQHSVHVLVQLKRIGLTRVVTDNFTNFLAQQPVQQHSGEKTCKRHHLYFCVVEVTIMTDGQGGGAPLLISQIGPSHHVASKPVIQ